jgi:hypothetical protein
MQVSKKLFLNGCSFVHGDDLMWPYTMMANYDKTNPDYLNILKQFNISGLAEKTGIFENVENIARYGATNDLIVFSTIEFFNKIPQEDRSNYVACIGWSDPCRIMVPNEWAVPEEDFSKDNNIENLQKMWFHLNLSTMNGNDVDVQKKYKALADEYVRQFTDSYWFKEHIKNILILENYFKANNIDFVFWNSIGFPLKAVDTYTKEIFLNFIDWSHWMNWVDLKVQYMVAGTKIPPGFSHPYDQKFGVFCSMLEVMGERQAWTKTKHPGPEAVSLWTKIILKHLVAKNVING